MIKHVLFAAFSLILFFELVYAITAELNPEWKSYQKEYYELLADKMGDENLKKTPIKLTQIWDTELNRADRCMNCHMGIDKPNFKDAPQPFTTHPDLAGYIGKHPFAKFGCTVCHEGDGRAITYKGTHGEVEHLDKQPLEGKFIEASCTKCHFEAYAPDSNIPEMPNLMLAKKIVRQVGCGACHSIKQLGTKGTMGPELSAFGSKSELGFFLLHDFTYHNLEGEHTMVNWLVEHFEDPQKIMPGNPAQNLSPTIMPQFGFSREEAEALSILALSFKDLKTERIPPSYLPKIKKKHKGFLQYN